MSEQGTTSPETPETDPSQSPALSSTKYRDLRIIAGILRVLAYIVALAAAIGIIVGIIMIVRVHMPTESQNMPIAAPGFVMIGMAFFYGAFGFLGLFTASQLILLLIDLESNTRESSILLRRMIEKD